VTLGTLPTAPSLSAYNISQWSSSDTKWASVKTSLDAFVNNITDADDLDTVVTKLTSGTTKAQIAMYAQDLERKQQGLRDLYSAANSSTGAKGFLYPNLLTVALKLDAQQKYQFDLSQTARDLIKYLYEWAKTNYQFAVEKGISAHQADVDFNVRFANELIASYTATLSGVIETYKAKIYELMTQSEAKLKEISTSVEILKTNASVLTAIDDVKVKVYAATVQDTIQRLNAAISQQTSQIENKIKAYSAAAQASATMAASSSQIILGTI
jgi:hypothetical protein